MLSRVADSLYWMSRYLERAEHTTRLLEVNLNLMLDESATSSDRRWQRVLQSLNHPKDVVWTGDPYALTRALTFDTTHKSSILSLLIAARENSRHVREQISTEQWHRLNSLYLQVTGPNFLAESEPSEFLQQVMEAVHQFQGVSDSTMSHGEAGSSSRWPLHRARRRHRRAARGLPRRPLEPTRAHRRGQRVPRVDGLLRSATAFEAYCKVYTADLSPEWILEFLLLDEEFPHSLRFSIDSLQNALSAIQRESGKSRADQLRRLAGRLQGTLSYSGIEEILSQDIVAYLRNIQVQCREIHNTIYELYIDYSIQTALAN
ncbi:alpha-E domain-containing protein [Granulicella sp. WH15]|uniref:alpha-E domain-containing protein n=1 Tax=Granulicella sp. WH15 TaxID=2602070 RepID=UPI0013669BD3|nr:alpha-E domain-containing protein [Granulicella sp. WH15]QHN05076.1 alpha-E domain-containing protein [Granulicella sp. WH15]